MNTKTLVFKTDSSFTGEWEVDAAHFAANSEHIVLDGDDRQEEADYEAHLNEPVQLTQP